MKRTLAALALAALTASTSAQPTQSPYVPDADPLVRQKIEQWQDLKLGLLMHWGTYSQWGIVESWSLCAETSRGASARWTTTPRTRRPTRNCRRPSIR
jgi:alpha-L-fucosidase